MAESDPELPWKLVRYMIDNGAWVPSEHVAGRNPAEMLALRIKNVGRALVECAEPWKHARRIDFEWVTQATHVVALVNGPSHGVEMEIQYALDKPKMRLNFTPVLALVRKDLLESGKVTWMLMGIEQAGFYLRTYTNEESARETIRQFLTNHLN